MRLPSLLLAAVSVPFTLAIRRDAQSTFSIDAEHSDWDKTPHSDVTGNLIFNSVVDVLQLWPNSLHRHGHSLVAATIPAGTVLYHGRSRETVPDEPDWLAFDFEHAYLFARGNNGHVLSFMTSRALKIVYIDGAGAAKIDDGSMDSQDIIAWRGVHPEYTWKERERIRELCKWASGVHIDGFVRQEFHFELMQCDFSDGLDLITSLDVVPSAGGPRGWKGSLPTASFEQATVAGKWHDRLPGETRVQVDLSGFVSFYDPALTSLVEARRGQRRAQHRLLNISTADIDTKMAELENVLTRATPEHPSGVDWKSVTHVIVDRYADRLKRLERTLGSATSRAVAVSARNQLLIMLEPYLSRDSVPSDDGSKDWLGPVVYRCAASATSYIPVDLLTEQERLILASVDQTLHEICRRLARMWEVAFDVEEAETEEIDATIQSLRRETIELVLWLDWSIWVKCRPACAEDEMCYIPMWPFGGADPDDMTPRCLPYPSQ
ncbi:hypothetical protein K488DRAFT_47566 [Vararia minispora EC-137]|uniref:Uncharacterized protein n=1 Tax=Vararia minispora EC-137 TaxID=1314806 RepID=A0ACB8QQA3_9AGAM|nr:hypothetical protein K488DRAFT_47566 [Vararia minispora EC-137]